MHLCWYAIKLPTTTVRHKDCEVLINSSLDLQCQSCAAKYRITLQKYYTHKIKQSTSITTKCNFFSTFSCGVLLK